MSNSGFTAFTGIILIVYAFFLIIAIVAWVKIISKAGYSGWWVLIGFVPLVGAIMFLVFAFSKWPVQQRLEAATMGGRQPIGPDGQYGGHRSGGWSDLGGQQGPQGPMGGPQGPSGPQGWSPQPPSGGQQPPGPYIPPWN
jgi:hypothetical protein